MRYGQCKKPISFMVLLVFMVTSLGLTGCTAESQEEWKQISFTYTLTAQEVEDVFASIAQLETCVDNGKNRKITAAYEDMDEKTDYIVHQYVSAEIGYYSDLDDDTAYERYVEAEEYYMDVREEYMRVMKKLYASDLSAKDKIFADWTAQQLKELETSNEAVIDLERQQNDLLREYLELEAPESASWSKAVEDIYFDYIACSQQLAAYYGYDNFYDYIANEIYMRQYTDAQREAFRSNVKEVILPFYIEVAELYDIKRAQLTKEQKAQFDALRREACPADNAYLTGYIDSYPEEMRTIMHNLFDKDAAVYTQSDSAYVVAYTNYSEYYDQPYVFYGNGAQDLLTVVHELGHYASFYHFTDAALPYDTCEVHSQANEWLMLHYLSDKLDPDVYEAFLLWRLDYGLSNIVACTVVDAFEELVYQQNALKSPEDFQTVLYSVLNEYENIDYVMDYEDFYIYAQYVTMESPVYYLSYATSELVSMLFYTIAEEQGYEAAQDIYIDLCLETPIGEVFFDTLMDVGLPNPFETDTVRNIIHAYDTLYEESVWNQAA
ncbi:MAG: hypothetical protein J6K99_07465 [Peptococcaceae bacterium]|nr:hypothetical protein [Peptococcaceae bacterium]